MRKLAHLIVMFVSIVALTVASADAKGTHGGGHHVGHAYSGHKHLHLHTGAHHLAFSRHYHHVFTRHWWANHPHLHNYYWHHNIWLNHHWRYWWRPATWVGLSSWIAWNWGRSLTYNYGSNFYYSDDSVYFKGRRLCSAAEYYDQAVLILEKIPKIADNKEQWMPLGVFSVTLEDNKPSKKVLQLAISKEGVLQGTYFNMDKDTARPIKGMVDKKSQRAVWTFADDDDNSMIMETGISNLTKDATNIIVHFGKDRTETWQIVRLKEPPDEQE